MWPEPDDPDFCDDDPDPGLDPEQIPFDSDEESEPEPGDFCFDDDEFPDE